MAPPGQGPTARSARCTTSCDAFPELDEDHTDGPAPTWRSRLRDLALGAFLVYMVVGFFGVWVVGFVTAARYVWG